MRKLMFALMGTAALFSASAASAAVTIGTTGSTCSPAPPSLTCTSTSVPTDLLGNPNKVEFDTTNAAAGTFTSFFNFTLTSPMSAAFSATTATNPASQVTLLELLLNGVSIYSSGGTGNSLNLLTNTLAAGPSNNYQFRYTVTLATAGDVSGPASFYTAVPEPATWGLMLLGFGGLGMVLRRRRRPGLAQIA